MSIDTPDNYMSLYKVIKIRLIYNIYYDITVRLIRLYTLICESHDRRTPNSPLSCAPCPSQTVGNRACTHVSVEHDLLAENFADLPPIFI